jgi:ABC-type Fe3+ transport system substrate-binding protein
MKMWALTAFAAVAVAGQIAGAAAQWAEAPAIRALYDEARREGQVILWGTQQREIAWVPRAFSEMFPGVEVKTLSDGEIVSRVMTETRSGRYEFDVLWTGLTSAAPAMQRNIAATLDWSQFGVGDGNLGFDGRMGFTNNIVYVVAYSAEHVKEADVPRAWEALSDDKYAGKMATSFYALPPLIASLGAAWGEEKAIQFTRDLLTRAGLLVTRGPRDAFLKSGERPYAVAEIDTLARLWSADGLPIRYLVPSPVVATQFGVIVLSNAPHASAARLLAGWMASNEGKAARERATGSVDYRPGSRNALARTLNASGAPMIFDTPEDARARDALTGRVTAILNGLAR